VPTEPCVVVQLLTLGRRGCRQRDYVTAVGPLAACPLLGEGCAKQTFNPAWGQRQLPTQLLTFEGLSTDLKCRHACLPEADHRFRQKFSQSAWSRAITRPGVRSRRALSSEQTFMLWNGNREADGGKCHGDKRWHSRTECGAFHKPCSLRS